MTKREPEISPTRRTFFTGGLGVMASVLISRSARADAVEDSSEDESVDSKTSPLVLEPLGGGADDWPRLIEKARECANVRPLILAPGKKGEHWICKSAHKLPSGLTLIGGPRVVIEMKLAATGKQRNTAFCCEPTYGTQSGALAQDIAPGSQEIVVSLPWSPAIGSSLIIANPTGLSAGIFTVTKISGSTLTLDRPVPFPFLTGYRISEVLSYPRDIRIIGNGMRITGTGDRAIEFIGALDCHVSDVSYDTTAGCVSDSAMSFDIGCRNCDFTRCDVDMTGGPDVAHGILLESNERSRIVGCRASNCARIGLYMVDSSASAIVDSHSQDCGCGIWVGTDDALGNFDCEVVRCSVVRGNLGLGGNRGARTKILGMAASAINGAGISFGGDGVVDTLVASCSSTGNQHGLLVGFGAKRTIVRSLDVSESTAGCLVASDEVDVDGLIARRLTATQNAIVLSGSSSRLMNFDVQSSGIANAVACMSSRSVIGKGRIQLDGPSSIGIYAVNGQVTAREISCLGGRAIGLYALAGATARLSYEVDLTQCARPTLLNPGAFLNTGTLVNSRSPIDVPWPSITANDFVAVRSDDKTGAVPKVTVTPGVGFQVIPADDDDTTQFSYQVFTA